MESTLSLTKYWLEKIVIGLDLCPFARIPFERGLIRLVECASDGEEDQLHFCLEELEHLEQTDPRELSTTLIVYPKASSDFIEFYNFVGDIEYMLEEAGLADVFQLVVFHPKFVFENTEFADVGNLVNRSPFPVLHLLRSEEIARALKNPKDGEIISFNNDKKLRELSKEAREQLFYYLDN